MWEGGRGGGCESILKTFNLEIIHHTSISPSVHINWNTKLNIYIHIMQVKYSTHVWHKIFGYPKTLLGEGKTGVGMTPTNLHYCSNKVYPMKVTIFRSWDMIYPIKIFQRWLGQRWLGLTLLKDFNTLLKVCLVKGIQLTIK